MTRPISLELLPTTGQHNDIVLTFGSTAHSEDSYYFAHDPEFMPGETSPAKASTVIAMLLGQWLDRLSNMDGTCYLPCGFSDQHVTWIRCESAGDNANLSLGWSEDEGWEFTPSNLSDRDPSAFEPFEEIEPMSLYRPRLLSLIRANRIRLLPAS